MSELSEKKIIGITGTMGAGKSEAARIVREHYPVLDCDRVNARLLEPGEAGYKALAPYGFTGADGRIDKRRMAAAMFNDPQCKAEIEAILHPLIRQRILAWIDQQNGRLVFIEMPLLFETGSQDLFDEIWCVCVDDDLALYRLKTYRHISEEDARARIRTQSDPASKRRQSDVILWNNGTKAELRKAVEEALRKEQA
ncbi:dephospho-CoA kinase [Catenisphaera adipataccumulans]|jgi:dephospho-CoA kinase|uniref:Dephospho-CoA kinase n=1 Tax=Catenisphaera adipataccumulans TaxID=700500 RepID=A0A7W8D0I8_9FIRM|nr:dephospho-CoA kinase [Catenisphaera adipataccumulans]MBB5183782.1 dephospho-CoA kinase [Catenisphaera adipataccumulans]